ncbi:PIG-L deacetylase family protein [Streptosporangium sp. NPDC002721]|uniref:PIG-L deacetylase family protein n=1 Tax=Streptosporangium sp. NPDC002721 TaxID=3366188 RepID=UPI0036AA8BBB
MSWGTVVVSPHFDDAVLSAAGLLARREGSAVIVTVLGGAPGEAPSAWDRLCGFASAEEASRERRAEDARACEILGVDQVVLDNPDVPAARLPMDDLEAFLTEYVTPSTRVLVPMGIGNADHEAVRDRALDVLEKVGSLERWAYADLPYAAAVREWGSPAAGRALEAGPAARALAERYRLGARTSPRLEGEAWALKWRAALAYASQIAPLACDHGEFLAMPGPLQHELVWVLDG